jgi:hypothetical protein
MVDYVLLYSLRTRMFILTKVNYKSNERLYYISLNYSYKYTYLQNQKRRRLCFLLQATGYPLWNDFLYPLN